MNKLLFVDDEKQILKSLKRMLMDTDYDLYTAGSGAEALEILEEVPDMDLIISDMRMPEMDGLQLLTEVKKRFPKVVRVILSGFTDEKVVFRALQENIAKLYILKPWNSETMLKEIEHVFATEKMIGSENVVCLLNNGLPFVTVNTSYGEILNQINAGAEIDDIIGTIEKDMVVTANILRIANSAFFNAKTGSIRQALLKIGKNGLHTFLLTASVMDGINMEQHHIEYLGEIWKHAFLSNRIYTYIYDECLEKTVHDISSSAGLLHKIGLIILLFQYRDQYVSLLDRANQTDLDLLGEEEKLFGVNHPQVGAYLLEGWDFPYPIIETTLYYMDPLNPLIVHTEVLAAVHVAQYYAAQILGVARFCPLKEEVFGLLKVTREEFETKLQEIDWSEE